MQKIKNKPQCVKNTPLKHNGIPTNEHNVDKGYTVSITSFSLKLCFLKLGFTPCKTEQPLQGMELQKKEAQKD